MKTLRYVQSFVDRKSGTVYHYFRRPGYKRVPLPGLPGSREFMAAYQDALEEPRAEIGASTRSIPGSVSAAIARRLNPLLRIIGTGNTGGAARHP
jgi:hypothetical protein